jgi:hypothetical protein
MSDETAQEISPNHGDHEGRRDLLRPGGDGGHGVHRGEERLPLSPAGVRVLPGRKELLELVNDQD